MGRKLYPFLIFMMRNELRTKILFEPYDPILGIGSCGDRVAVNYQGKLYRLPKAMLDDSDYKPRMKADGWKRLRCRHDFEYWSATCAFIKSKRSNRCIPAVLNEGQRSVVEALEADRTTGKPIRAIVLKARQWGCSTLVQLYIAWIQTCVRAGANAMICAHLKNTAATIRGMYTRLLANYPQEAWQGTTPPALKNYEGSSDIKSIAGRDCTVMIGSCINPDAIRGSDISLAHLTEVAYWRNTPGVAPEDVAQAVFGTVNYDRGTMVVLESTANGIGNFFHREWLKTKSSGHGHAIFVPWCELSSNFKDCEEDRDIVFKTFDETERSLFDAGLCFQQIYWRRCKRLEMDSEERFNAEFPLHDTDAFASNELNVFDSVQVEELRLGCDTPAERGGLAGTPLRFISEAKGRLSVWQHPAIGATYIVTVDVGGRSAASDWSVVAVMRAPRNTDELPEVVAQWRGHIDHDILAQKAIDIARYYNRALLVIESNTLETENYGSNAFVLEEMARRYSNMYVRRSFDSTTGGSSKKLGFHTNRSTKPMLIGNLIAAVRCRSYIEHDSEACNELLTYRRFPNGSYGAEPPMHDDILMTRAIALFVLNTEMQHDIDLSGLNDATSW